MADTSKPFGGFRIGGDRLNPLLEMAKTEGARAPTVGLAQLSRLLKASAENARTEADRLKAGGGDADAARRAQQGDAMAHLVDLVERARKAADVEKALAPMTLKGGARFDDQQDGLTIEIVEDSAEGWVATRAKTDAKGRFEMSLDAPASAYDVGQAHEFVAIARTADGVEVGRSAPFAFKAGKSASLLLQPGDGKSEETYAALRKAKPAEPAKPTVATARKSAAKPTIKPKAD